VEDYAVSERIRLLIVDDSAETRDSLTRLLGFEPEVQVVGWAASGEQCLEQVERVPTDVVLLDINMPGMNGIATAEELSRRGAGVAIVMMSVQSESSALRSAMRAGAREFLVKPFSADELVSAIRQAHEREREVMSRMAAWPQQGQPAAAGTNGHHPQPQRPGQVVSVFSPKGGVGRTTVAVNLAVTAAQQGQRVAIVDACLQFGDVGVLLNLDPRSRSVADIVAQMPEVQEGAEAPADDELEPPEQMLVPHESGVSVLLAPPSPELADTITAEHLTRILTRLRSGFDLVVVDVPSVLNDTTLPLLDASDVILCMLTLEITCIKNVRHFLQLADRLGYPPTKVQLLINRADAEYGIRVAEVEESLDRRIAHSIMSDWRRSLSALNRGQPLVSSAPKSRVSRDLDKIVRSLLPGAPEPALPAPTAVKRGFAFVRPVR
jgi:pilus assembly protein CpaE